MYIHCVREQQTDADPLRCLHCSIYGLFMSNSYLVHVLHMLWFPPIVLKTHLMANVQESYICISVLPNALAEDGSFVPADLSDQIQNKISIQHEINVFFTRNLQERV